MIKTKFCSKCGNEKPIDEFYKRKDSPDGHRCDCKKCRDDNDKLRYINNRESILEKAKENYPIICEAKKEYNRKYYYDNHDKRLEYRSNYYNNHKEECIESSKIWRSNNPDYEIKGRLKKYAYRKEKYDSDPLYKLKMNARSRISKILKQKNIRKNSGSFMIIGCTPIELKFHIEKQFTGNMSWDNYGRFGWHIDHIRPIDSGKNEEEILKLLHYSNLQPLWWEDNLKKGCKLL